MMIFSSTATFSSRQLPQLSHAVKLPSAPCRSCSVNHWEVISYPRLRGRCSFVAFLGHRSKLSICAIGPAPISSNTHREYWEDPVDGSDSDHDEDEEEEEEGEENNMDFESDWEDEIDASSTPKDVDKLSARLSDEDLAREVEQLLTPEDRAILQQNECPNLDKISTEAVISHLLRKGASSHTGDLDGATPLHYAVQVGAMQTVKLLIKYKVDVNAADNEGWTPLHVAMQTRNRNIAKVLLVNGADKTRRNKE